MAGALSDSFRTDLRCAPEVADDLARRARGRMARVLGSTEDSEEDLVLRFQDPRVFGDFAESLIADRGLPENVRIAAVERTFDLLPLPRTEGEVILVGARGPLRLLALAAFLSQEDAFTVLHAMHVVYAVFLDRSLLDNVPRTTRAAVLDGILRLSEATDGLRLLYIALHLGLVPEPEAHEVLRNVLKSRVLSDSFKHALAAAVAADDGGLAALMRVAQDEGLLPAELGDADAPDVVANIPRMPARLAALGKRWLDRHGSGRRNRDAG